MAEGPQAKLRAEWLHQALAGQELRVSSPRTELQPVVAALNEGGVSRIFTRGKNIIFALGQQRFLRHHLMMDGRWRRVVPGRAPAEEQVWLRFVVGHEVIVNLEGQLFELLDARGLRALEASLGPDLMADPFPHAAVLEALTADKRALGTALLDQALMAGVGNTAKNEALFVAGLHPQARAADLRDEQAGQLVAVLGALLRESYASGGRWPRRVHERAGQPCGHCTTRIEARKVGGRNAFFCPRCQPLCREQASVAAMPAGLASTWPDDSAFDVRALGPEGDASRHPGAQACAIRMGLATWGHPKLVPVLYPKGTPAKERVRYYATRFTMVEGNSTFYGLPSEESVARWAEAMPPSFRFWPKVPREVTHEAGLAAGLEAGMAGAEALFQRLAALGERVAPAMLLLPPGFRRDRLSELERFLRRLGPQRFAVEPRDLDLCRGAGQAELLDLLRDVGAHRAFMDTRPLGDRTCPEVAGASRKPHLPLAFERTGAELLLRYISYPDLDHNRPWIAAWSPWLASQAQRGQGITLCVHCPDEGLEPAIAAAFREGLLAAGASVAEPEVDPNATAGEEQLSLF